MRSRTSGAAGALVAALALAGCAALPPAPAAGTPAPPRAVAALASPAPAFPVRRPPTPGPGASRLTEDPALLAALGPVATAPTGLRLPDAVDMRAEMPPVRDQARRPMCEIFAVCAALDHLASRRPGMAASTHSPQFLWWSYQRLIASQTTPARVWGDTGTEGPYLALLLRREAFEGSYGLRVPGRQGVVAEELAPFEPEQPFDAAAGDPAAIARAHLGGLADRLGRGEPVPADGARARFLARDLGTIKQALAAGHPVVVGLPVTEGAWRSLAAGQDLVPEPAAADLPWATAHAVLLVGYVDDPSVRGGGAFRFRNAWGPGWAQGGYGRVSYAFVGAHAGDPYYLEAYDEPFAATFDLGYP